MRAMDNDLQQQLENLSQRLEDIDKVLQLVLMGQMVHNAAGAVELTQASQKKEPMGKYIKVETSISPELRELMDATEMEFLEACDIFGLKYFFYKPKEKLKIASLRNFHKGYDSLQLPGILVLVMDKISATHASLLKKEKFSYIKKNENNVTWYW